MIHLHSLLKGGELKHYYDCESIVLQYLSSSCQLVEMNVKMAERTELH